MLDFFSVFLIKLVVFLPVDTKRTYKDPAFAFG
jgi:hypothetical protein